MGDIPYPVVRELHISFASLSLILYLLRSWWLFHRPANLRSVWARRVPHVNDTLLLVAAAILAMRIHQYPLVDGWLTAKLLGVLAHIALAMLAFRGPRRWRLMAWLGSVAAFGYVVAVALTRNPWLV